MEKRQEILAPFSSGKLLLTQVISLCLSILYTFIDTTTVCNKILKEGT